jgi:threonine/homoserine/homoserine lactone efflux protein
MAELAAFLGVAALVIVTPGQDTALTIRNTVLGGRAAGIFTAIGVSAGQAVWTLAASAGIGALLVASEPAFLTVKLVGSAYLVFLGVQALWGPIRSSGGGAASEDVGGERRRAGPGRVSAARQGLLSNLGNPKMLAFFTSLLPQFGSSFGSLVALGLVFCSLTLAWLIGYAVVVARGGDLLRRARVRRVIEAVTGTVLVALGLRVATERRG